MVQNYRLRVTNAVNRALTMISSIVFGNVHELCWKQRYVSLVSSFSLYSGGFFNKSKGNIVHNSKTAFISSVVSITNQYI